MDVAELTALAHQLGQDGFQARFPHLFLVLTDDKETGSAQFSTQVVSRREVVRKSSGGGALRVLPLVKAPGNPYSDRISIGRARNCDVVIRDPSVSKLHAHIRREPNGAWVVIDLDSHNGTAVSSVPILPSRAEPLRPGEYITFGGVTARVVDAGQLYALLMQQ
ncbi:MAG: FHA domain-containing protein [Myxococcales bacterium]|nr:FHA domain-containing protein [Myxococcota bacterium]MDW8281339.1 FHA domain-containing protein [Myxococcales bacterium]